MILYISISLNQFFKEFFVRIVKRCSPLPYLELQHIIIIKSIKKYIHILENNMLSKPLRESTVFRNDMKKFHSNTSKEGNDENILSYHEFFEKKIQLKTYKLPQLKDMVKKFGLPRTGNKCVLIERIEGYFCKMKVSTIIQKNFRSWMVRQSFKLRGDAYKNRKVCVNDTDFVTLEPLDEIPNKEFYSYKDSNNFIYGFNIFSLIEMIKSKGKIHNPYNREKIPNNTLHDIISLNNIIYIIFPEYHSRNKSQINMNIQRPSPVSSPVIRNNIYATENLSNYYFNPRIMNNSNSQNLSQELRMKYCLLVEKRNKPIDTRIQEIFIEIDQLGNYTQSQWFSNLDRRQ